MAAAEEHFGSIDVLDYSPAPTLSDLADRPLVSAVDLAGEAILPELETNFFGAVGSGVAGRTRSRM